MFISCILLINPWPFPLFVEHLRRFLASTNAKHCSKAVSEKFFISDIVAKLCKLMKAY